MTWPWHTVSDSGLPCGRSPDSQGLGLREGSSIYQTEYQRSLRRKQDRFGGNYTNY